MIFSFEFSKLLEPIIFRNIFICVEKLNYIKKYMKARCETRRGGRPAPHFVLRNWTELLQYTRRRKSTKCEGFIKAFLKWDQDRLSWKFSAKIKPPHFLPSVFFYLLSVYRRIPFHAILPSFLVCWKNLDQFLLKQSLVIHPAMTVNIWKFLAFIVYSRSLANIPGTLKVNMIDVLYFYVIYRVYLNCNAKL